MEKTIKWEHSEAMTMQAIEQERLQALAQVGALMLDLETAKKNLDTANEKQKSAVRQILASRGIERVESARPIQGGLVVSIPDSKQMTLEETDNAMQRN